MLSNKTKQHFDNKIVWITGASSGIGRALAIALSDTNCQIYISARTEEKLEKTKSMCSNHSNIHIASADLTDKQANLSICKQIKDKHERLDIAILNAGSCEYVDIDNFKSDIFERMIKINYLSMIYGIEACLPLLHSSAHAQLVGMSSTAAYLGLPRSEAYGSSKAAIRNLFRALKVSLAKNNIDASVICPGFVKTELTDQNDFPMPNIISSERATEYILTGIAKKKHEIHFPKSFSISLKLVSLLPNALQFKLLSRMVKQS